MAPPTAIQENQDEKLLNQSIPTSLENHPLIAADDAFLC